MKKKPIVVYEHEVLKLGTGLDSDVLATLQAYFGEKGVPYFSLVHQGVKFCEYVGVIQIGDTLIEILPKTDKSKNSEESWRSALISMLKTVGAFDIHSPSSSSLNLKSNSILELYFELLINEVEYLLQRGLVKRYKKVEGNLLVLKGCLQISKHVTQNLTHQERFYCKYNKYSHDHTLHQILFQAIELVQKLNKKSELHGRIARLLLSFPEVSTLKVSENTFEKFKFDRKNESYRNAFDISKLLLLNFHPDVSRGRNNVLAIMFDMNDLWEKFVHKSLARGLRPHGFTLKAQNSKSFWQKKAGSKTKIRPDLYILGPEKKNVVLDTKWKNLGSYKPSSDDLRQMYVYHEYYDAFKVALIYPGSGSETSQGFYLDPNTSKPRNMECSILPVEVNLNIYEWQKDIVEQFLEWFGIKTSA